MDRYIFGRMIPGNVSHTHIIVILTLTIPVAAIGAYYTPSSYNVIIGTETSGHDIALLTTPDDKYVVVKAKKTERWWWWEKDEVEVDIDIADNGATDQVRVKGRLERGGQPRGDINVDIIHTGGTETKTISDFNGTYTLSIGPKLHEVKKVKLYGKTQFATSEYYYLYIDWINTAPAPVP